MRSLEKIKDEFESVKATDSLNSLQKTMRFVQLMNELEQDYHTFIEFAGEKTHYFNGGMIARRRTVRM